MELSERENHTRDFANVGGGRVYGEGRGARLSRLTRSDITPLRGLPCLLHVCISMNQICFSSFNYERHELLYKFTRFNLLAYLDTN